MLRQSRLRRWIGWGLFLTVFASPLLALFGSEPPQPAGSHADWARLLSWGLCTVALGGILIVLGLEWNGRFLGFLIDERNRYSLSRLQISLWTVLVLASLYTVLATNVLRTGVGFVDVIDVDIDWNLVVLLGLSVTSFLASPIALSVKAQEQPDPAEARDTARSLHATEELTAGSVAMIGRLMTKAGPPDARLADLVKGEEVGNATALDLTRFQMLVITLIVVTAYAGSLVGELYTGQWHILALPALNQTLLGLILVSHASYITGKLIPKSGDSRAGAEQRLARALRLSRTADELVSILDRRLESSALLPFDRQRLESLRGLARTFAAKAAGVPSNLGNRNDADPELSRLEGQLDALRSSIGTMLGDFPGPSAIDAPAPELVADVQRSLARLGYDVRETGVPDHLTEAAITDELIKQKLSRDDLHKKKDRFYEEVRDLLRA